MTLHSRYPAISDLKARARDSGATGWIVKPFAQDKLIRALRMVAG